MKRTYPMLSRTISIVGAGIVLATFVVKDVLSDLFNYENDSLNTARSFYLTQTPINFIEGDVNQTQYKVSLLLLAIDDKGRGQSQIAEDKISTALETNKTRVQVVSEYIVTLASLITKIPQDAADKDNAVSFYAQCLQVTEEIKSLQNRESTLVPAFLKTPKDPKVSQQYNDFASEMVTIPPKIDQISHNAATLTKTVVSHLESTVQESDKRYKAYTVLSYMFFGIGWVTSLTGQLLGVSSEK